MANDCIGCPAQGPPEQPVWRHADILHQLTPGAKNPDQSHRHRELDPRRSIVLATANRLRRARYGTDDGSGLRYTDAASLDEMMLEVQCDVFKRKLPRP